MPSATRFSRIFLCVVQEHLGVLAAGGVVPRLLNDQADFPAAACLVRRIKLRATPTPHTSIDMWKKSSM